MCRAVQGGLIPRLFQHLFERLRDSEREQREGLQLSYVCKVSCLEIYQVSTPPELPGKTASGADCGDAAMELCHSLASQTHQIACRVSCYCPGWAGLHSAEGAVHGSQS